MSTQPSSSTRASAESLLSRALTVLIVEVACGVGLGLLLDDFGLMMEWAMIPVWAANLLAAWYLAQAAGALGRRPFVCGITSALGPPVAIHWFWMLYQQVRD